MQRNLYAALVCGCFLGLGSVDAKTIRVPGDFPNINGGLTSADYGDTVLVSPGRYYENVTLVQGVVLTISGEPLKWRISAPGLAVSPSDGTLREGVTEVINLRAHRIRNWCGSPATVTAPLTVHGLDDSISTTVRWRTC